VVNKSFFTQKEERMEEDAQRVLIVWPSFTTSSYLPALPSRTSGTKVGVNQLENKRWILNSKLEVRNEIGTNLRGLFAVESIKKGDKLLSAKASDFWTVEKVLNRELPLIDSSTILDRLQRLRNSADSTHQLYFNDKVILALGLLHVKHRELHKVEEQEQEVLSHWQSWIETLPTSYPTLPLCFDVLSLDESREKFLPMDIWNTIYQSHRMMKSIFLFLRTQQLLPQSLPQRQNLSESEFRWAYASVQTRSWKHPSLGIIMIPFADLINHNNEAWGVHFPCSPEMPPLEPISTPNSSSFTSTSNPSTIGMWLLSSRDYPEGSQVFANYGPRADHSTLTSYGYVDEGENRFNSISLWEEDISTSAAPSSNSATKPCVLWNGNLNAITYKEGLQRLQQQTQKEEGKEGKEEKRSTSNSMIGKVLKFIRAELLRLLREHPPFADFELGGSGGIQEIVESRTRELSENVSEHHRPCLVLCRKRGEVLLKAIQVVEGQLKHQQEHYS
jgi:hypothetical protein